MFDVTVVIVILIFILFQPYHQCLKSANFHIILMISVIISVVFLMISLSIPSLWKR